MNKIVLCLYDTKAELYNSPFVVPTIGVAYRNLADEVGRKGDPANQLAMHPEDFVCVQLGTFDEESGLLFPEKAPKMVFNLKDLVVSPE